MVRIGTDKNPWASVESVSSVFHYVVFTLFSYQVQRTQRSNNYVTSVSRWLILLFDLQHQGFYTRCAAKVFYTSLQIVGIMKAYEFEFPEDRYYMKNHVWLKPEKGEILIGITELGQSLSKGIVHIDLPEIGESVKKGDMLVAYETIKAVSQISLPFDAEVTGINEKLWEDPNIINGNPYGEWLVKIKGELCRVMKVNEAVDYYTGLIAKERERYADN